MGGLLLLTVVLVIRAGIGWDRVSARYIIQEDDTLYLDNDVKLFLEAGGDQFTAALNLSSLYLSSIFSFDSEWRSFDLSGDLELYRYHNPDTLHLNHLYLDLNLEYRPSPLGLRFESRIHRYATPNQYFQDLNGLGIGLLWDRDQLQYNLTLALMANLDHIPDSLPLSNLRLGPDLNFFYRKGILEINGYLTAVRILYPDKDDNRYESDLNLDLVEHLSDLFSVYEEWKGEVVKYDHDDEISYDQRQTMIGLGPEVTLFSCGRFRLGPRLRYERNHPLGSYHDYVELSLYLNIEILLGNLNLMIENELGQREYEMEFYVGNTSYRFDELSVIGGLSLFSNLEFQIISSYGPEWHTMPQDNSTFFLLSTRLAYRF
ncbi:hypothetical protein DRP53_02345 [candidate division WOR-3 bacterium]|uniref:Uncharacterized protein n=1 Tax=candidate division WOR-3 bacterium TaxID=2052148 RepID=A0A660SM72_UNCW3|nr:MAG: hypothetical protein DRP53_02345 [candidate division WOR-3 bacterium]